MRLMVKQGGGLIRRFVLCFSAPRAGGLVD
jgi:hypothetical protein